jgi:hypothetical protein
MCGLYGAVTESMQQFECNQVFSACKKALQGPEGTFRSISDIPVTSIHGIFKGDPSAACTVGGMEARRLEHFVPEAA